MERNVSDATTKFLNAASLFIPMALGELRAAKGKSTLEKAIENIDSAEESLRFLLDLAQEAHGSKPDDEAAPR